MRVALALVVVLGFGCAKSADRASNTPAPTNTGGAQGSGEGAANADDGTGNHAADTKPLEQPKGDPTMTAPPPPGGGGSTESRNKGSGSAVEAARTGGMLGPADSRAFATNGKVSIKSFTSKDLDAQVKTKLDAVQTCYDKALEFKDTLAGELTITVKDVKATVSKTTVKNAELEKCVVEALAGATLPKAKSTLVLAFKRE
jgi:hypothetical protein